MQGFAESSLSGGAGRFLLMPRRKTLTPLKNLLRHREVWRPVPQQEKRKEKKRRQQEGLFVVGFVEDERRRSAADRADARGERG